MGQQVPEDEERGGHKGASAPVFCLRFLPRRRCFLEGAEDPGPGTRGRRKRWKWGNKVHTGSHKDATPRSRRRRARPRSPSVPSACCHTPGRPADAQMHTHGGLRAPAQPAEQGGARAAPGRDGRPLLLPASEPSRAGPGQPPLQLPREQSCIDPAAHRHRLAFFPLWRAPRGSQAEAGTTGRGLCWAPGRPAVAPWGCRFPQPPCELRAGGRASVGVCSATS